MAVTGTIIMRRLGYTKRQIERRRQRSWAEGIHYWRDPEGAIVYDLEEIEKWQRVSAKTTENALSGGHTRVRDFPSRPSSHIPRLE